jgi:hypothetical protein
MKKIFNQWEGLISLVWIILMFLITVLLIRYQLMFEPLWLFYILVLLTWWGVGLVFAISGLKRGHWINRACAVATLCAFALFVLAWLWPVYSAGKI